MPAYSDIIEILISALTKLPGIGPKSAERIVFHILKSDTAYAKELSYAVTEVKNRVFFCERCFNLAEDTLCHICANPTRNHNVICVVEEPKDVMAIEKAGGYSGVYHVLLGSISAMDGIGPSKLKIQELTQRIAENAIEEVILATSPTASGDATAIYLADLLKDLPVIVSRISKGVPIGSSFDYLDQATIACAIQDRHTVSS